MLLTGGGNLGSLYPRHQAFRERVLAELPDRTVVQLPQSMSVETDDSEAISKAFRSHPDFRLVVRDHQSASAAARLGLTPVLCPDLSLVLASGEWRPGPGPVVWIGRDDREASGVERPADVRFVDWSERSEESRVERWTRRVHREVARRAAGTHPEARLADRLARIRTSSAFRAVTTAPALVTERLHGHLLAVLSGVPHVLVDDREGKIRAFCDTWHTDEIVPTEWAADPDSALAAARRLAARPEGRP